MLIFSLLFYYFSVFYTSINLFRAILNRMYNGYIFVIPVFISFFVLPGIMDAFLGLEYDSYPELNKAFHDYTTNIIYNLYIGVVLFFFTRKMLTTKAQAFKIAVIKSRLIIVFKKYSLAFWFFLILPIFLILISGNLEFYLSYFNRDSSARPEIHATINKLHYLTLISASLIITYYYLVREHRKYYLLVILLVLFLISINIWIDGKRSILIKYFFTQFIFLFISGALKPISIIRYFIAIIIALISFISFYGKNISDGLLETYSGLRVDFSRDYGLKFAIYNDLLLDNNILPYRGASYLFNVLFFVPRSFFGEKPQPYAVYFTNSAFGNYGEDYLYGWGLTTSFVTEAVSNLGWLGLLFFPLFYSFVLSKEAKSVNPYFKMLSYLVLVLLLVIQPMAFMPLILLLIYFSFRRNIRYKNV